MRAEYTLWQKLRRQRKSKLTPEEYITPKERIQLYKIFGVGAFTAVSILFVLAVKILGN